MAINREVVEIDVNCSVEICYNGEYIIDSRFDLRTECVLEDWYESDYGTKCYNAFIEQFYEEELIDKIFDNIMMEIDDMYSNDDEFKVALSCLIQEQVYRFDFEYDTETLNVNINIDYIKEL